MLKKTLAAVGIAGALIVGSAAAAFADYPAEAPVSASTLTIAPGGTSTITVNGLGDYTSVDFSVEGAGATLSSIVAASSASSSVTKPVVSGSASAQFTASAAGTYVVRVSSGSTLLGSVTITVTGSGAASGLPPTGGSVPAAVIWAGVGAVGLGGIAVAAVAARRRTQKA